MVLFEVRIVIAVYMRHCIVFLSCRCVKSLCMGMYDAGDVETVGRAELMNGP